MSNDDPKTLALRWFHDLWNLHREETIFELLASDAIAELEGGSVRGPDELAEKLFRPMLAVMPSIRIDIDQCIAEGNDVATLWTASAVKPDGTHFSFSGMTWMTFENGKIIKGSDRFNLQALHHFLNTGEPRDTVRKLPSPLIA